MKKNSKKKKVVKKKAVKTFNKKKKLTGDFLKETIAEKWFDYINRQEYKPLSKAEIKEIEKEKKEQKIAELKEQKRRAKKITMTVGKYEDAIERAKDEVRDYQW
ncbi:MAG: hypothetical protein QG614_500 [Patescibacteria group bacterium]|nr:hypothetical protein [Patescibacteria group bacterium]